MVSHKKGYLAKYIIDDPYQAGRQCQVLWRIRLNNIERKESDAKAD